MKDGRPSLLFDIRCFLGDRANALKDQAITAHARRLAWVLNGEGLSLGAFHSLYVHFSTLYAPGQIHGPEPGGDWWQKYVVIGVPPGFPDAPGSQNLAADLIAAAITLLRPDAASLIDAADTLVRRCGGDLRFLVRTKAYRHVTVMAATTMPDGSDPALLHVALQRPGRDEIVALPPLRGGFYFQAFSETAGLRLADMSISTSPDGSLNATWKPGTVAIAKDTSGPTPDVPTACWSRLVRQP